MLKILRKKGVAKKLLWIVASIIILSFGLLGQASLLRSSRGPSYAGRVFGRKVSLEEYEKNFLQTQILAMIQHGNNYKKVRPFLNLEGQTWDRIILLHEARKRKIEILDEAVVSAIQNNPMFVRDGRFDQELYEYILRHYLRISPRDYEEGVRDSLKFAQLYAQETFSLDISPEEVLSAFRLKNERVQVSYVLFEAEDYKADVVFDEIQARNYYLTHKDEFLLPPRVKMEYIRVPFSEETPEGEDIPEEILDGALQKASEVAYDLNETPDFETVAQRHGLNVETSGFFSMEQPELQDGWSFPLIQRIFQLQPGEISEPVETASGFQIMRIREKIETTAPDYPQVKDKVKEAWTLNQAKELAQQKATEFLLVFREEFERLKRPDFAKIAKENNLQLYKTSVFNRGQYLPVVGISRDFQETAFSLAKEKPLSDVVMVEKGACILHLDNVMPLEDKTFEEQREALTEELLLEKRAQAFNDFLTHLRIKADPEDNISKTLAKKKASP